MALRLPRRSGRAAQSRGAQAIACATRASVAAVATLAAVATPAACTVGGGAMVMHVPEGYASTSAGARLDARLHVWGDEGMFVGVEETVAAEVSPGRRGCCDQWRARGMVGYSHLPAVHRERVGFEAALAAGLGRFPTAERAHAVAFVFGPVVGVPIRLTPTRPPWAADDLLGAALQLVPELSMNGLVPFAGEGSRTVRYDVSAGLSVRLHVFSGALQ